MRPPEARQNRDVERLRACEHSHQRHRRRSFDMMILPMSCAASPSDQTADDNEPHAGNERTRGLRVGARLHGASLFERYNEIIDEVETDPSRKIDFRP
jgi:hypothetical protein